ncbi:MAG TPA: GFA family protein [Steroidobacteraceae bacterium]|nr:GFA family protein [Steroidobacteraceae bacterium]
MSAIDRKALATGGCQCGAVRYAFYTPLENAHVCHCRMCQRASGGVFAALAGGAPDNFAWTRGSPAFFASSNLAKRAFCEKCGTPLSFKYDLPTARIYVSIGSLDHPEDVTLVKQYGIESRLPWVKFCEAVPAECTAESAAAQEILAKMSINQRIE